MKLSNNFSVVYHDLLEDLIEKKVPTETWADCSDCHLCKHKNNVHFHTKCCDYTPSLPNFSVGSILANQNSTNPEGKRRLLNVINERFGVSPYGIFPSVNYQRKLSASRKDRTDVSQQSITELKCPYYNQGNCSIYEYRSDICGFYHCSSVALNHGKEFWKQAHNFNTYLDRTISIYISNELGFNQIDYPEKLKKVSSYFEHDNGELNEKAYQEMWGTWYGKEVEYFVKCEKLFRSFDKKKLGSILKEPFEKMKNDLIESANQLFEHKVPDYLCFDKNEWEKMNETSEKEPNPIEIILLQHFDGKTKTEDIVKKGKQLQANMTPLLIKSIRDKVLQPVE